MPTLDGDGIRWDVGENNGGRPAEFEAEAGADEATPELIDVGSLLSAVETFVRRFVVLNEEQGVAVSLWTVHTHAFAASDCTPYIQVTSATMRAGKTRLLEVLEPLVARPWFTGRTTGAAMLRKIEAESPTLLFDEYDATFKGPSEFAEALRGLLNSGYRRGGKATQCVGTWGAASAKDFSSFCPKMLAGIGRLPGTLADRAIPIALKRRTALEPISRWRHRDGHRDAEPIRKALAAWATTAMPALRDARPELPQTLTDRAMDTWEPLLAIADAAGPEWAARSHRAATVLMGEPDEESIGIQLLGDLRDIFHADAIGVVDALPSATILERLAEREERAWRTWSKGRSINGHALARLLKPFGVQAGGPMRIGGDVVRGYRRAAFEDAWTRYLSEPVATVRTSADGVTGDTSPDTQEGDDDTWQV